MSNLARWWWVQVAAGVGAAGLALACRAPTSPSPGPVDFLVDVAGERFVLRLTEPETIRRAEQHLRGVQSTFPLGPLGIGDGGFNRPWSWHLDPAETRLVDSAIELCDGRPSYIEAHQDLPRLLSLGCPHRRTQVAAGSGEESAQPVGGRHLADRPPSEEGDAE